MSSDVRRLNTSWPGPHQRLEGIRLQEQHVPRHRSMREQASKARSENKKVLSMVEGPRYRR